MPYEIKPICPKCGNMITIKLNIVDKLQARVRALEAMLKERDAVETLKDMFGIK